MTADMANAAPDCRSNSRRWIRFGILYYNFRFDQPAQFNNALITSKNAAQEVDFYSVTSSTEWLTVTGVIAFAVPGTVRHR